jgi:MFS family permease
MAPSSTQGRHPLALLTVLTAQFMFAMDLLIVVVALPRIAHDLGFQPAGLTWVLNAFGLAFGGLLLLGGRLGDMLGQLRAFRAGIAVFVVASLLGGLAQTPALLVAARVLQGAGAALAGPSVLALVMASRSARWWCWPLDAWWPIRRRSRHASTSPAP